MAAGLDYSATDVSEATFRDVFLPPFAAGVEAGALTLMSAFIAVVARGELELRGPSSRQPPHGRSAW